MANPLAYEPIAVDPRTELTKRLQAAPTDHAEAMLVMWDLLQSAHEQGILDLLHGAVAAKDTIFAKVAEYAKEPEGVAALRNLVTMAKILGSIDPEALEELGKQMVMAHEQHGREQKAPGVGELFKRVSSEDGRRGLSMLTLMLTGLGRALPVQNG